MNNKSLFLLTTFLFLSCVSTPKQTTETNSAIAITIGADVRSGYLSVSNIKPKKVYFIRLNSINDSLFKNSYIISEYNYENMLGSLVSDSIDNLLFNVEPGIYAAVAAYGETRDASGSIFIIFPEKMVKSTIVEVQPNSVVYAGKYFLNRGSFLDEMKDADDIQKYYYLNLAQKIVRIVLSSLLLHYKRYKNLNKLK